jgi:hypothetical protein
MFPTLVSVLTAFAEGSLALESRAGGRPGARTLLWWPSDTATERLLRLACLGLAAASVVLRLTGRLG